MREGSLQIDAGVDWFTLITPPTTPLAELRTPGVHPALGLVHCAAAYAGARRLDAAIFGLMEIADAASESTFSRVWQLAASAREFLMLSPAGVRLLIARHPVHRMLAAYAERHVLFNDNEESLDARCVALGLPAGASCPPALEELALDEFAARVAAALSAPPAVWDAAWLWAPAVAVGNAWDLLHAYEHVVDYDDLDNGLECILSQLEVRLMRREPALRYLYASGWQRQPLPPPPPPAAAAVALACASSAKPQSCVHSALATIARLYRKDFLAFSLQLGWETLDV
ncbi:uncharacterized protein AMSG_05089 [Thecamonas trahens ATCC 50062]|uniref:Uncharacterized protein n=1 Tax=Thecamonas trahens ATCC 50062 TaxID=461836 RepID=A0A0L0D9V8_THETB|nr:hypothetical protein AMSG_05089 [Thecamonas trahens ATCC 50062]KNC49119.1 hypothetical protein AMSG_05089 [Thecamonas trahens ATCC 50062]|eukprot:XP_013758147.1 hypothetical protein AMSG_05089 [Thecamonas trahens ATCC 50062]